MRIWNTPLLASCLWIGLALTVAAQTSEVLCIVCGEHTQGGQAVLLGDRAYAIHEFGCLPVWQRAEKLGLLEAIDQPLVSGDAIFQSPALTASDPADRVARGSARVWAAFLIGACLMSGSLAALFGLLTNRPLGRAFVLGFFLPAVGMVLVPVLPDLTRQADEPAESKEETS